MGDKNHIQNGEGRDSVELEDAGDDLRVDEAKIDETKLMDFAKVKKRVRTTGGGSTGTMRYGFFWIDIFFLVG